MIPVNIPRSCIFLFPFALGILIQKLFPIPFEYLSILFIFSGIISLCLAIIFKRIAWIFFIIFTIITGIFLAGNSDIGYEKTLPVPPERIDAVTGIVKDVREKGVFLLITLEKTMVWDKHKWLDAKVNIRTILPGNQQIYNYDRLILYQIKKINQENGEITITSKSRSIVKNSESISKYQQFNQKISAVTESIIKKWFKYHGQQAAIFRMMVLGNKRQSLEIKNIFIKTGTYHLLIVSGLHLGYVLLFLRILFFLFRHIEQAHYKFFDFLYLFAIGIYAVITGFNTPVVRATLMLAVYLIAEILERPINGIESIGWAGFIILFIKPEELFNMGFQLSFAATTGIILTMRNTPQIKRIPEWLDTYIRAIAGAQIFTIPVLAANIGSFYPAGFVTNFFLVPVGGLVVCLGLGFLIFGFLRSIIIFPLIKGLDLFWISNKLFSNVSPEIPWSPDIISVLLVYSIILMILFRNKWKFFASISLLLIVVSIINLKTEKSAQQLPIESHQHSGESITIFPCRKLLCSIEKENRLILIVSEKENETTLNSALENLSKTNKNIVFFFTAPTHDIIGDLEFLLSRVKPVLIIDNPEIRKHPAFGYRKSFILGNMHIKQDCWKFLVPGEGIRIVYDDGKNMVIEYHSKKGTILIATYLNSKIFEVLPFSPRYHAVYATKLALSKKLAEYFQEYQVSQVIYQKLTYNTLEKMEALPDLRIVELKKTFTID
ncbi:MAG TPA: ComEC/Rec2 family competence protein [bacterium]|nr:ComEC/Rec2 family competence protein [bacterium]